jgi:hypothetical protein
MEILIAMIGIFAAVAVGMIWRGYVFSILWDWFAVPAFGLPALSLAMAIGIALLVNYATYRRVTVPTDPSKTEADKITDVLAHIITYPLIVLGMGWIVKQYL